MDLSRRSFLKITGVGLAAIAAPIAFSRIGALPVIIGDGKHDDTKGLQAAFDGKDFVCPSNLVASHKGYINLHGGTYRITETLELKGNITMTGGTIIGDFKGTLLNATGEKCNLMHMRFVNGNPAIIATGNLEFSTPYI